MLLTVEAIEIVAKYILVVLFPIFVLYIMYLIVTKAFKDMGFSKFEAIVIVFVSFLFEFQIMVGGFNISNIHILYYNNWDLRINMGGAIIPIIISIYLAFKKKLEIKKLAIGIIVVTVVTYLVTRPVPESGIVSSFPFWLFPAIFASIISVFLLWKDYSRAAPFAYISGTIGVLIGADFFHLFNLLSYPIQETRSAVIGGAVVMDMIFITGILAVIIDGIILSRQKTNK